MLRELRVGYVIVHADAFGAPRDVPDAATVLARLQTNPHLKLLAQHESQWAFELLPE